MMRMPPFLRRVPPGVWSMTVLVSNAAEQVEHEGWDPLEVDLRDARGKDDVLARLGVAGSFPAHYGRNWDAAYDCLTDLSWRPEVPRVLLVRGPVDTVLRGVFEDAVDHWAASRTPLWIIVHDGDAPALDEQPG